MDDPRTSIIGGAGAMEAAAIAAVVQYVLELETESRSRLPAPRVPSPWVRLGSPRPLGRFTLPVLPDPGRNSPS